MSSRTMSKVSSGTGIQFALVQSMFSALPGRFTISVSLGLRPVDSTLVHVASAPHAACMTSRPATHSLMISGRGASTRTSRCPESMPVSFSWKVIASPSVVLKGSPSCPGRISRVEAADQL